MNLPENIRTTCLLCGNNTFKHPFGKKHFLIQCKKCGMASSGIVPTEEELKTYYFEYPSYDKISPLTLQRYNEILDKLEPYRKNNLLLETGCGFGFFLEAAMKRKWNVMGTELSENALVECRRKKIQVFANPLTLLEDKREFDAIVSLEVVEHLKDPVSEIALYSRLLRPKGALYITTPNYNSLSRRLLGKRWNVVAYPEHIHYFSPQTIHRLLEKEFDKITNQTTGVSPARLMYSIKSSKSNKGKDLENYDFNEVDRQLRDNIEKTILLRLIKSSVNKMLTLLKSGDSLKVLYQKKA